MFRRQLIYLAAIGIAVMVFSTIIGAQGVWARALPGYAAQFMMQLALALSVAGILTLAGSTLLRRGPIQAKGRRSAQVSRELRHALMWLTAACMLGAMLSIIIGKGWSAVYLDLASYPSWYMPLSIIVALVILDAYAYFSHRFLLHGPLYEKVHKVHHLSTRPNMISQFQLSPIEQLITSLFLIILICVLPLHPIALLVVSALTLVRGILSHSGREIFPSKYLNWPWLNWLNPNTHHDLHHKHFTCNYGLHFRWWDKLLGTEHPEYTQAYSEATRVHSRQGASRSTEKPAPQPIR